MGRNLVDVYCADEWVWNGANNGKPGTQVVPGPPPSFSDARVVTPYIPVGGPWSATIDKILDNLNRGDCIRRFFTMGHGCAGEFTVGETLTWQDDKKIAELQRLQPHTSEAMTYVHVLGCEAAADRAVTLGKWNIPGEGLTDAYAGTFSGSTGGWGYQLLRKLADAIGAPVSGSTLRLPFSGGWQQQYPLGKLTVGPGGAWAYRAFTQHGVRFGSP